MLSFILVNWLFLVGQAAAFVCFISPIMGSNYIPPDFQNSCRFFSYTAGYLLNLLNTVPILALTKMSKNKPSKGLQFIMHSFLSCSLIHFSSHCHPHPYTALNCTYVVKHTASFSFWSTLFSSESKLFFTIKRKTDHLTLGHPMDQSKGPFGAGLTGP
eukprot:TRINITY_DN7738_c0_g4_i2.p1 TRINITY_DN7738_c0_g4~~TRINITY_DN7738_c0_g4_i2.p1  ORF type:complete len:158 (+),score=8.47 TRINITY_DN7738_c0_g4_i2:632-1105(+)